MPVEINNVIGQVVVVRVFYLDTRDVIEPCIVPDNVIVVTSGLEVNTELLVGVSTGCSVSRVESEEVIVGVVQDNACITVVVSEVTGEVAVGCTI